MKQPVIERSRRRPSGTTLVEALITFLVLSLGLLAVSKVQGQLRLAGETARQRSEAVRLAEEDIEQLRGFSRIASAAGTSGRTYADIVTSHRIVDSASGYASNTVYRLSRIVAPSTVASARDVSVTVSWLDRAGQLQTVELDSVVAANDPALTGALGIAPAAAVANGPMARAVDIPRTARNLGDGRSAWSPVAGSSTSYLFDNATGVIGERCQAASAAASVFSAAALGPCSRVTAYLLSGVVRFATGITVDSFEPVRPATIELRMLGAGGPAPPECSTTSVVANDGDRYLQYVCIVYPRSDGRWSGETQLVPDGWTLARSGRSVLRICVEGGGPDSPGTGTARASSTDSSRLARYADVAGTLVNQNFRVVRGGLACPV